MDMEEGITYINQIHVKQHRRQISALANSHRRLEDFSHLIFKEDWDSVVFVQLVNGSRETFLHRNHATLIGTQMLLLYLVISFILIQLLFILFSLFF